MTKQRRIAIVGGGMSGLAAATQIGADYPFDEPTARQAFNYYGGILHGTRFRKAKAAV